MRKINVAPLIAAYHLPNETTASGKTLPSRVYYLLVFGTAFLLAQSGLAVESFKGGLITFLLVCCGLSGRFLFAAVRPDQRRAHPALGLSSGDQRLAPVRRRRERYYSYLSATVLYGWLTALVTYIVLLTFYFYEPSDSAPLLLFTHRFAAFAGLTEFAAALFVAARQLLIIRRISAS